MFSVFKEELGKAKELPVSLPGIYALSANLLDVDDNLKLRWLL
jgi:hypothetical protein